MLEIENLEEILEKIGKMYDDETVSLEMKRALLNLEIALLHVESIKLAEIVKAE